MSARFFSPTPDIQDTPSPSALESATSGKSAIGKPTVSSCDPEAFASGISSNSARITFALVSPTGRTFRSSAPRSASLVAHCGGGAWE